MFQGSNPGGSKRFFYSLEMSRVTLGPTHPTYSVGIRGFFWGGGVKWTACEVDHSPLYSAEVKNVWSHTYTSICLHGVYRDNFTFTIYMLVLQVASSLQAFCPVFGMHFSSLSCIFTWHRLGSHW